MPLLCFRILFCTAITFGASLISSGTAEDPAIDPAQKFDAELPKEMLKDVEAKPKHSFGIRPEENQAYYQLLWYVRSVPEADMKAAEIEFRRKQIEKYEVRTRERILKEVEQTRTILLEKLKEKIKGYQDDPLTYPLVRDAFNYPEDCQGKPISFQGHVRKAISYPAGENDRGIKTLYELWLFEQDAKGFPVVVVCTEVPDNFPLNFPENQPLDGVSVRGYFFKLFAYEGREDYQAVPLLLAKRVEWNPAVVPRSEFPVWAYGLIVVLGFFLLYLILFRSGNRSRRLQQTRERMATTEDNPFA